MNCPACKSELIVIEKEEIELDYCPNCRGLWFDEGELALLWEKGGVKEELAPVSEAPPARTAERKRSCPRCRRKMEKRLLGKDSKVVVDVCPVKEGLWFDAGELAAVVRQHQAGQDTEQLSRFLGEAFTGR